jgi:hypothetical protein
MNLEFSIKLVPMWYTSAQTGKKYVEQVIVYVDGYPIALMHIDTYYADRSVYDQLRAGKEVDGKIILSAADPEEDEDA